MQRKSKRNIQKNLRSITKRNKKDLDNIIKVYFLLVHLAGIEPVRVAPLDPKSSASASSAIGAFSLKEGTCPS